MGGLELEVLGWGYGMWHEIKEKIHHAPAAVGVAVSWATLCNPAQIEN